MAQFMLLLHRDPPRGPLGSPEELLAITRKYIAWADRMRAEGRYKGGEKLRDDPGKVLRPGARVSVTDGPYAESKEAVAGYFLIMARDYDEACQLAQTCPHLEFGGRIEVRQIHEMA